MKLWNNYWYGPVAAIRPYLLLKGVLILLAVDLWNQRVWRGAIFYDDRFQMAHFQFLEWLPTPTPALYVGIVLLCGLLSFLIALAGMNRVVLAALCLLYTWLWAITRMDSFQHHYLLSLVLLCLVFFPKIGVDDWCGVEANRRAGKKRAERTAPVMTSAWAFVMLGASIAIVFVYTAIAKLDALWLGGHTLRTIDVHGRLPLIFGGIFSALGRSREDIWPFLATSVVFVELAVAVGYLTAVVPDRRSSLPLRIVLTALWVMAMMLHLGFEALSLRIGWFSYYMLLAACVFLLPASWLGAAAAPILAPARRLNSWWDGQVYSRNHNRWILIGTAGAVTVILIASGMAIDLPGALATSILAGAGLFGCVVFGVFRSRGSTAPIRRLVMAMGIAPLVMWVAIANSNERFVYYTLLGQELQRRMASEEGLQIQGKAAIDAYTKADHYVPHDEPRRAFFHNRFGLLYDSQSQLEAAVSQFRKALRFDPDHVGARNNLGNALLDLGLPQEALPHYQEALRLRPEVFYTHYHLAITLERLGRAQDAVTHYQEALRIEPDFFDAHYALGNVLQALGRAQEAIAHYEDALRIKPDHAESHVGWGVALAKQGRLQEAAELFREALRLNSELTAARNNLRRAEAQLQQKNAPAEF